MRKHLSVLGLWAAGTLHWVLGLLAVSAGAELALFRYRMSRPAAELPEILDVLVQESGMMTVCMVGFLLLCMLLSVSGCALQGSRVEYTLRRLSVREEMAVVWKAAYSLFCLLLFWAVQVGVMLLVCRWYKASLPEMYVSEQTVFLAVYRIDFFHGLLPLDNWLVWLRNAVVLLTLSLATACFSYRQRRGKFSIVPILEMPAVLLLFNGGVRESQTHTLLIVVCLFLAIFDLWDLIYRWRGGTEDEA